MYIVITKCIIILELIFYIIIYKDEIQTYKENKMST